MKLSNIDPIVFMEYAKTPQEKIINIMQTIFSTSVRGTISPNPTVTIVTVVK